MTKKIGLGLVALVAMVAGVVGLSAFEAHVINVTAKIENALQVATKAIQFGTVFPQEELEQTLTIELSDSFIDEDRVDDVEYIIRQKPKCGVTEDNGETLVGPTWTGHVVVTPVLDPVTGEVIGYTSSVDCKQDEPNDLVLEEGRQTAGLLPSLCEYISKHPDRNPTPGNDDSLNSFHKPYTVDQLTGAIVWNDVDGRLAKSDQDFDDLWTIDLKVPCFGDHCAQDWADFVHGINPDADPDEYVQDIDNEHMIFGCNLWIEVNRVSEFEGPTET